jgi:hypothetical protein
MTCRSGCFCWCLSDISHCSCSDSNPCSNIAICVLPFFWLFLLAVCLLVH